MKIIFYKNENHEKQAAFPILLYVKVIQHNSENYFLNLFHNQKAVIITIYRLDKTKKIVYSMNQSRKAPYRRQMQSPVVAGNQEVKNGIII